MLGSLSFQEIAFILLLALLIFGPRRLPEMGKMLGRAMGEFRRASNELRRTFNAELAVEEEEREPKPRRLREGGSKTSEPSPAKEADRSSPASPPAGSVARGVSPGPPAEVRADATDGGAPTEEPEA